MKIDLIAGARPNFMKIAPLIRSIKKAQNEGENITFRLIHSGQHYDENMSGNFFRQLNIPNPDVNLGAGGGSGECLTETQRSKGERGTDPPLASVSY